MKTQKKNAARTEVQLRLDALSDADYLRMCAQTRQNFTAFLSTLKLTHKHVRTLCYTANAKWREVDVANSMSTVPNAACDHLSGAMTAPFPDTLYDIILVPLYGFTTEGYRLGHGAGWYDQFLLRQPQALKIGIGLEVSQTDFVIDRHDVRLDVIITEERVLQFR